MELQSIGRTVARAALNTACNSARRRPCSGLAIATRAINSYRVLAHKRRKVARAEVLRRRAAIRAEVLARIESDRASMLRRQITAEDLRIILQYRAIERAGRREDAQTLVIAMVAALAPIVLALSF